MTIAYDAALAADLATRISGSVLDPEDAGSDAERARLTWPCSGGTTPTTSFHLNHNIVP